MRLMVSLSLTLSLLVHVSQSFVLPSHFSKSRASRSAATLFRTPNDDRDDDDGLIVQESSSIESSRRNLIINTVAGGLLTASGVAAWELYKLEVYTPTGFTRLPSTQFIAALGSPSATQGSGAEQWGLWRQDPGPRGVWLRDYESLESNNGVAPRGWKFDKDNFWIEEHGMLLG